MVRHETERRELPAEAADDVTKDGEERRRSSSSMEDRGLCGSRARRRDTEAGFLRAGFGVDGRIDRQRRRATARQGPPQAVPNLSPNVQADRSGGTDPPSARHETGRWAPNRYPVRLDDPMNSLLDYQAAAVGFAVAFLLVVLLTPVVSLAASRAGVLDRTDGDRRMHRDRSRGSAASRSSPASSSRAAAFGAQHGFWGVMLGAALMCALGAVDDIVSLPPAPSSPARSRSPRMPVTLSGGNISIDHVTLRSIGVFDLGVWPTRSRSSGSSRSPTS